MQTKNELDAVDHFTKTIDDPQQRQAHKEDRGIDLQTKRRVDRNHRRSIDDVTASIISRHQATGRPPVFPLGRDCAVEKIEQPPYLNGFGEPAEEKLTDTQLSGPRARLVEWAILPEGSLCVGAVIGSGPHLTGPSVADEDDIVSLDGGYFQHTRTSSATIRLRLKSPGESWPRPFYCDGWRALVAVNVTTGQTPPVVVLSPPFENGGSGKAFAIGTLHMTLRGLGIEGHVEVQASHEFLRHVMMAEVGFLGDHFDNSANLADSIVLATRTETLWAQIDARLTVGLIALTDEFPTGFAGADFGDPYRSTKVMMHPEAIIDPAFGGIDGGGPIRIQSVHCCFQRYFEEYMSVWAETP